MEFLGQADHPLTLLAFVTLAAALVIGIVILLRFLRKPHHRHPMDGQPERNIDQIRRDAGEYDRADQARR